MKIQWLPEEKVRDSHNLWLYISIVLFLTKKTLKFPTWHDLKYMDNVTLSVWNISPYS